MTNQRNYTTARELAEQYHLYQSSIATACRHGRIPGAYTAPVAPHSKKVEWRMPIEAGHAWAQRATTNNAHQPDRADGPNDSIEEIREMLHRQRQQIAPASTHVEERGRERYPGTPLWAGWM